MNTHIVGVLREYKGTILFLVLLFAFRSAVADWYYVPSGSMLPTIQEGDMIVVDKMAYDLRLPLTGVTLARLGNPARGDIAVFESESAGKRLVKRVVGVPGDTVELRDNRLIVNGLAADYEAAAGVVEEATADLDERLGLHRHRVRWTAATGAQRSYGPVTVPSGHYLVLGDNRDQSADSRVYGFVARQEFVGRARKVALSFNDENHYLPRAERFLHTLE